MLPMPPEVFEKSSAILTMHASCRMCGEQGLVDWTAVIGTVGHVCPYLAQVPACHGVVQLHGALQECIRVHKWHWHGSMRCGRLAATGRAPAA